MLVHNGRIFSDEGHAIRRDVPRKNNMFFKYRNYANCRRLTKITNVIRHVCTEGIHLSLLDISDNTVEDRI